jgi:phytepsin
LIRDDSILESHVQAIVAQVNHAIGAEGIISTECKEVVSQYGEMILNLLIAQVC